MNYVLEGKVSEKEFVSANYSVLFHSRRMLYLVIGVIIGLFGVHYLLKQSINFTLMVLAITIFVFVIEYLTYFPYKWKQTYRNSKKINQNSKWIINDECLEIISENSTVKFSWDEFTKYFQTKIAIFLGLKSPKGLFQILPLRLFNKKDEIDILSFIKNHIK